MAEDFRHGIDWRDACDGVPVGEFVDEGKDLSDHGDLEEAFDDFVTTIESSSYLIWEAVIREEQGLPLSEVHEEGLDSLLNFGDDDDDDDILYINEIPRPPEPWYETLGRLIPAVLVEKLDTTRSHYEVTTEGWLRLVDALEEHGNQLSLPDGVDEPLGVVPRNLQHRLWLQSCIEVLLGIGCEWSDGEVSTLERPDEHYRVSEFIDELREHRDSVAALDLTLERLLEVVVMPPSEQELFVELFTNMLELSSSTDPIADHL